MKVCILTTAFPRWEGDDRGSFILNAARSLVKKGAVVRVIAIHSPGAKHYEMIDGIEVIRPSYFPDRLEVLQKEGGGLPVVWKKYPWARLALIPFACVQTLAVAYYGRDCDVIHANWTLSGAIAWVSRWLHGRPYLVTVHGSDLYQTLKMGLVRQFTRRSLGSASTVIAVSHDLARIVSDLGIPPEKQKVIPDGIDVVKFRPGSPQRENSILFVGSLIPRKGVVYLLQAFPKILQRCPDAYLTIAGEGPLEIELKQTAQSLGIEARVRFLGACLQERVSALMRESKVFVLPSLEEGLGVVLLEAIASGTPCVGSQIGGIPDVIIPEVGSLVPPENPDSLAEAICHILQDDQVWHGMSLAARSRAETIFSWDTIGDQLIAVYQQALKR